MEAIHHEVADGPCPSCGLHQLEPVYLRFDGEEGWRPGLPASHNIQLDACPGCEGALFDPGELDPLSGAPESVEAAIEASAASTECSCPRCSVPMRAVRLQQALELAQCPRCEALWLEGEDRRSLARVSTPLGRERNSAKVVRRSLIWLVQLLTALPFEVRNPKRGRPILMPILIALMFLGFGLELRGLVDIGRCDPARWSEDILAASACWAPRADLLLAQWDAVGISALWQGSFSSLLTHIFLHVDVVHLMANAYVLYLFGDNVEYLLGRLRFLGLFLGGGVAGALAHLFTAGAEHSAVLGASGAIAGVMAVYLLAYPRAKLLQIIFYIQLKLPVWFYMLSWFGLQLKMGWGATHGEQVGVAWGAHLGGFAFGLALGPYFLASRRRRLRTERAARLAAAERPIE